MPAKPKPVATPAAPVEPSPVIERHEPVPPPTAAMPHTQPATAVPAAPVSANSVAEASANPGRWGRVDADGTVYVKTADGERAVGSWHAGEPAEGLAHYARRFDDVRTEVELLAARLAAGSGDPKHTLTNAKHIKESLAEAALVGDLAGLAARLDHVLERAQEAVESVKHARDEARGQALARKQELVAEVEKIAESSTQWKVAGDRLRAILDEWKTIKGVDRKTDDQLWKRFSKARDTFNRRRGSHFADLDRQRATAKERKQELVKAGGGDLRIRRLGSDRGALPRADDRVEGGRPRAEGGRRHAVAAVPGGAGQVLQPALVGVQRARRGAGREREAQGDAARRGGEDQPAG